MCQGPNMVYLIPALGGGGLGGIGVSVLDCGPTGRPFASASHLDTTERLTPPVVPDWVIKCLGMSSRGCVTG